MDEYAQAGKYILKNAKVPEDGWKVQAKQAEDACRKFREQYGPEQMEAIPIPQIYDKLFCYEFGSMIYELRREDTILGECGHIARYKNCYPFEKKDYKIKAAASMVLYSRQFITKEQACEAGNLLRQKLILCVRYLQRNQLQNEEDYLHFEIYAKEVLGKLYDHGWVHKYFHILFPTYFTQFQSRDFREKYLSALRINGIKLAFESDFRLIKVQAAIGISDPYVFAHMMYSIPEIEAFVGGKTTKPAVPRFSIVPGTYGNWMVKSDKRILLKSTFQFSVNPYIVIPKEARFFFEEDGLPEEREIYLELEQQKIRAKLTKSEGTLELILPEETRAALEQRAENHQCDLILSFSSKRRNVYNISMIEVPVEPEVPEVPEQEDEQQRQAAQLPKNILYAVAKRRAQESPEKTAVSTAQYKRDPYIAEYAKRRANGVCQLCGQEAPFLDKKGQPYLESHHIIYLSKGGADSVENTVALCPNCHKKVHLLERQEDVDILQEANKKPMK